MARENVIQRICDAKDGGTTHDLAKALLEIEPVQFQESDRQEPTSFAPIPIEPGDMEAICIIIETP